MEVKSLSEDEVKMESLEDYADEMNDIPHEPTVYVQEAFVSGDPHENSKNSKVDLEMKGLKTRLKNLEAEVGSLRAELRLIKRKFRDVDRDPHHDKYRQLVEQLVAETLDNRRSTWRMAPVDSGPSSQSYLKKNTVSSNNPGRLKNYTNRLTFNDMVAFDSDVDPLDISITTRNFSPIASDDDNDVVSFKQSRIGKSKFEKRKAKTGMQAMRRIIEVPKAPVKNPNGQKVETPRPQLTISRGRRTVPEERKLICQRAKEIGPTAAGREFNLPESTIRGWIRKLEADANLPEIVLLNEEFTDDNSSNNNSNYNIDNRVNQLTHNVEYASSMEEEINVSPRKVAKQKYKQYISTPELKMQACQRAREVGATRAGRELNIPEGSIRHWLKFLPKIEQGLTEHERVSVESLFAASGSSSPSSLGASNFT